MRWHRLLLLPVLLLCACLPLRAQGPVPVVMLSDIHFDPFHNPHIVPQLQAAPIEQWPRILDATPDLLEDADRAATRLECKALGVDTPWPLLKRTLAAAHEAEARPVFVTLSGDLLGHQFNCWFQHLAHPASAEQLAAFSAKTMAFVVQQLRAAFPGVPVYVALGNNDSGCADYHETAGSPFLDRFAQVRAAAAGLPPETSISAEGDYSVRLPRPMQGARLLVLQNVFDSQLYRTCGGQATRAPEQDQIRWLRTQLTAARARHEPVWVMGHIPPGIDVFNSFAKYVLRPHEMCSATPFPFLENDALANTLLSYSDVVRLGVFAHTHMDEIRLLHRATDSPGTAPAGGGSVPLKLVPSVTAYFGNHPAFLVAEVDPKTMVLRDWKTYVSLSPEGSPAPWPMAYQFTKAYGLPDASATSIGKLADGFTADRYGHDPRSSAYRSHFFAGDAGLYALGLSQIWPAYACSVRENRAAAFRQCLCGPAGTSDPNP